MGIHPDASPPAAVVTLAAEAAHIVASDLRRAVESAERLAPHRTISTSPLIREAPLAIPRWPTRLPLPLWESLIHGAWSFRRLRGADASGPDWTRAATAAQWLVGLVADGTTALVVTHGVFRHLLGAQLIHLGWTQTGRRDGYRPWSYWTFAPGLPPQR